MVKAATTTGREVSGFPIATTGDSDKALFRSAYLVTDYFGIETRAFDWLGWRLKGRQRGVRRRGERGFGPSRVVTLRRRLYELRAAFGVTVYGPDRISL